MCVNGTPVSHLAVAGSIPASRACSVQKNYNRNVVLNSRFMAKIKAATKAGGPGSLDNRCQCSWVKGANTSGDCALCNEVIAKLPRRRMRPGMHQQDQPEKEVVKEGAGGGQLKYMLVCAGRRQFLQFVSKAATIYCCPGLLPFAII